MPTFKPVIRGYIRSDNKCRIYIRIIQKRKASYIPTDYYIEKKYFRSGKALPSYPLHGKLNKALYLLLLEYENITLDIPLIRHMDVKTLTEKLTGNSVDFYEFTDKQVQLLREQGRDDYADSFLVMVNHMKACFGNIMSFSSVNLDLIQEFLIYLKVKIGSINSVKVYIERLKTLLYIARDNGIIKGDLYYLKKIKIKNKTAEQKGLTIYELKRIFTGPYPRSHQTAIDLFKLSFYLSGANLKDLLYLKEAKDRINYERSKTGYPFSVKIIPEAEHIINRYRGSKYLLKFLDKDDSHSYYKNFRTNLNKRLKDATGVTFYSARHSYATIAFNECQFSLDWIDYALQHKKPGHKMTEVYLKKSVDIVDQIQEAVTALLY